MRGRGGDSVVEGGDSEDEREGRSSKMEEGEGQRERRIREREGIPVGIGDRNFRNS